MPIKSYHRISFCISPTTATSKQRTKISGPWSAHTRWPGVHSKWYDLHLLKVIWLRPSLGAKQGREPNQPQALQYPKDKIKDFWRESTTISRDYHLKENAPSHWPHTQLGHWELEPPQHIRNLLSTLHYLDVTVPLSCLLPSALFRPTLPHALSLFIAGASGKTRLFQGRHQQRIGAPRVFESFLSPPVLDCCMWSLSNSNQTLTLKELP